MMQIPDTPQYSPAADGEDKKKFTWIGLGLFCALALTVGAEYLLLQVTRNTGLSLMTQYLLADAAMLCLAFPAGVFFLRKAGKSRAELGVRRGFAVYASLAGLATELGLAGQILGMYLSYSGISDTETLLLSTPGEAILYTVIIGLLAPIGEELFFRKYLTDALRQWGWMTAVVLGALFYALFHANVSQFFMALGLGAVLTYAYLTTGKIRVPILIHLFLNMFYQVIPLLSESFLCGSDTLTALEEAAEVWVTSGYQEYTALAELLQANPGALAALFIESFVSILEFGMSLAGMIVLFLWLRKAGFKAGERQLEKKTLGDTVFLSPGIVLFFLCSIVLTVVSMYL